MKKPVRWVNIDDKLVLNFDNRDNVVKVTCGGSDNELISACQYDTIEDLEFFGSTATDDGFRHLARLRNIERLYMPGMEFSGEAMAVLVSLRKLSILDCSVAEGGELAIEYISQCNSLRVLRLRDIRTKRTSKLGQLTHLEELTISSESTIGDDELMFVGQLSGLRKFSCECPTLTDRTCEILVRCGTLQEVDIARTHITDLGLKQLQQVQSIRHLLLAGLKITAEGIEALAKLPNLEELVLNETPLGDAAVAPLARCKSLKRLSLEGCRFTKAGIMRLVESTHLERLDLDEELMVQVREEVDRRTS